MARDCLVGDRWYPVLFPQSDSCQHLDTMWGPAWRQAYSLVLKTQPYLPTGLILPFHPRFLLGSAQNSCFALSLSVAPLLHLPRSSCSSCCLCSLEFSFKHPGFSLFLCEIFSEHFIMGKRLSHTANTGLKKIAHFIILFKSVKSGSKPWSAQNDSKFSFSDC